MTNDITLNEIIQQAHDNAVAKGFWDTPREVGTMLALIHSEISEALEADREGDTAGFTEELADTIIRICDLAGGFNLPLQDTLIRKMKINQGRGYLHGKQY